MQLGPIIKLDKRNTATPKKIDGDVMSANSDVVVILSIHGQIGATWKPDFGSMVCNTYSRVPNNREVWNNTGKDGGTFPKIHNRFEAMILRIEVVAFYFTRREMLM